MSELIYFIVYKGILLDINVLTRNICLGLKIIVVGNEIFHRIFGEKLTEFGAKLCRKCLVVGENEGGAVDLSDNICHGKGLTRACDTEQGLVTVAASYSVNELCYSLRLISRGLVI